MLLLLGIFLGLVLGVEVFKVFLFSMFISGFGKCVFVKVFVVIFDFLGESLLIVVSDDLVEVFVVVGGV